MDLISSVISVVVGSASAISFLSNFFILNLFAMLLMVFVVSLAYMLGKAIGKQEYIAFAKVELFQIVMSFLILLFGFGIIAFFESMFTTWAGCTASLPDCTTEKISIGYLDSLLYDPKYGAITKAFELKKMNLLGEAVMAFGQRVSYPGWGVKKGIELNKAIGGVVSAFTDSLYLPFRIFIPSVYLQRYIIDFIGLLSLQIILPIGLFLRTLPPTRNGGTFLIALALGLKTIFVFTYVMHYITVIKFIAPIFHDIHTGVEAVIENPPNATSDPDLGIELQKSYILDDSKRISEITRAYREVRSQGVSGYLTNIGETLNNFFTSIGSSVNLDSQYFTPQYVIGGYAFFNLIKRLAEAINKAEEQTTGWRRIGGKILSGPFVFLKNSGLLLWVGGIGLFTFMLIPTFYVLAPTALSTISWLVLQGIFLPALSFIITSTFIQVVYRYLSTITA